MTNPTPTRPEPTTPTRAYRPSDKELVRMCEGILLYQSLPAHLHDAVKAVTAALLERLLMAPSFVKQRLTSEPAAPTHRCVSCKREYRADEMYWGVCGGWNCNVCRAACVEMHVMPKPEPAASAPVPTREVEEIRKRHEAREAGHKLYAESGRAVQAVSPQVHDDCATLLALLARSQDGRRG